MTAETKVDYKVQYKGPSGTNFRTVDLCPYANEEEARTHVERVHSRLPDYTLRAVRVTTTIEPLT